MFLVVSEFIISTVVTGSITGAGLVFASYGILVAFYDKIVELKRRFVPKIRENINPKNSSDDLRNLATKLDRVESVPLYISNFIYVIFILYIISVLLGLFYLNSTEPTNALAQVSIWAFGIATALFGFIGISMLSDFLMLLRNINEDKGDK